MRTPSLCLSRLLPWLAVALLVLTACQKKKAPSAEYSQAAALHSKLYSQKLDDAYLDPQMDEVEALLHKVPPDSLDVAGAQELLQRISDGRARVRKDLAARQKDLAAANAPTVNPFADRPRDSAPTPPPPEAPAALPDAGVGEPMPGMKVSELNSRFSRCFQQGESLMVKDVGVRDTYELKDITNCRDLFPRFVGQILIVDKDALWQFAPKSAIRREVLDGGAPDSTDAGTR